MQPEVLSSIVLEVQGVREIVLPGAETIHNSFMQHKIPSSRLTLNPQQGADEVYSPVQGAYFGFRVASQEGIDRNGVASAPKLKINEAGTVCLKTPALQMLRSHFCICSQCQNAVLNS